MAKFEENNKINSFSVSWQMILNEYEQALNASGKSPKTVDEYISNARKFFTFLENMNDLKTIENIGKKELRKYIEYLQSRTKWPNNPHIKGKNRGALSPFTQLAYARDIKTLWSWMHKDGYIKLNPLADFPLPKVPENLMKTVTPAQFATLLSNIDTLTPDGLKYYCILLILYDNGMRLSELINIKIDDVDFQGKTIKVVGKGRRERLVPITTFTRRLIIRYIDGVRSKICQQNSPYLLANSDGEPISKSSVQQFMKRLLARSDLKGIKFSPHILRHSFATQYLANGGNVFYLKAILGHKSLVTTLRYTQVKSQDIQQQHTKCSPVAELFRKKS